MTDDDYEEIGESEQHKADQEKAPRGRPVGSRDTKKIKLKIAPEDAKKQYHRLYGEFGLVAIYGVDKFTEELIRYLWKDPNQDFVVTDPIEQKSANLTRQIGSLPYSAFRYDQVNHVGFIESGRFPVVVVAKEYKEKVLKLPNPYNVEIVCLEDL